MDKVEDFMKVLVIYDSVFGNTEKIARAIGASFGPQTEVARAGTVKLEQLKGLDLLIVGSPTRQFKATEATMNFLNSLSAGVLQGVKVAAFDTRLGYTGVKSLLFGWIIDRGGYAAKLIAEMLTNAGGNLVLPPEGFLVKGEQGPLKAGELERAANWLKKVL
jgi:flavodoxin